MVAHVYTSYESYDCKDVKLWENSGIFWMNSVSGPIKKFYPHFYGFVTTFNMILGRHETLWTIEHQVNFEQPFMFKNVWYKLKQEKSHYDWGHKLCVAFFITTDEQFQ